MFAIYCRYKFWNFCPIAAGCVCNLMQMLIRWKQDMDAHCYPHFMFLISGCSLVSASQRRWEHTSMLLISFNTLYDGWTEIHFLLSFSVILILAQRLQCFIQKWHFIGYVCLSVFALEVQYPVLFKKLKQWNRDGRFHLNDRLLCFPDTDHSFTDQVKHIDHFCLEACN